MGRLKVCVCICAPAKGMTWKWANLFWKWTLKCCGVLCSGISWHRTSDWCSFSTKGSLEPVPIPTTSQDHSQYFLLLRHYCHVSLLFNTNMKKVITKMATRWRKPIVLSLLSHLLGIEKGGSWLIPILNVNILGISIKTLNVLYFRVCYRDLSKWNGSVGTV